MSGFLKIHLSMGFWKMIFDKLDTFFVYAKNKEEVKEHLKHIVSIRDTQATWGNLKIFQVTVSRRLNEDWVRQVYGSVKK